MNQERETVARLIRHFVHGGYTGDCAGMDDVTLYGIDLAADAILALRSGLNLSMLRDVSVARQHEWKAGGDTGAVGGLYRANELGGEVGEALNVVKKLEREARGWRGSRATVADLAAEIADVVICADLLAAEYDIDLSAAVISKFNATSEKVGLSTRLPASPSTHGEG